MTLYSEERKNMVDEQLRARGIDDELLLEAFLNIERHI